tara:strand:+ start:811 stop:1053 length:243 start_codon:yes stop_codon:yes gene_type:complete
MASENAKLVSTGYTGNTTLPASRGREYFLIQPTGTPLQIKFGDGSGSVTIQDGSYYEPYVAPSTSIEITSAGTYTVVTNV